jgi:hypothetical protein
MDMIELRYDILTCLFFGDNPSRFECKKSNYA